MSLQLDSTINTKHVFWPKQNRVQLWHFIPYTNFLALIEKSFDCKYCILCIMHMHYAIEHVNMFSQDQTGWIRA